MTSTASGPMRVEITVLGGFRVTVDGAPTNDRLWARRNAAALVKILALTPGHRLHREKMMDLLWPDESPDRCAPRLHKAAYFARQAAGHQDAIVLRDDVVWLFPGADLTVDAARFEDLARAAVTNADPLTARRAIGWYGGELLPEDRYEDWAIDRRELLHLRQLEVLRIAGEWRELVEQDPTNEDAHVELMHRHLAAGDADAALRQYGHLERMLERELGVTPGAPARRALDEAIDMAAGQRNRCAADDAPSIADLLTELAELVARQTQVLAELAACGATGLEPACQGADCT